MSDQENPSSQRRSAQVNLRLGQPTESVQPAAKPGLDSGPVVDMGAILNEYEFAEPSSGAAGGSAPVTLQRGPSLLKKIDKDNADLAAARASAAIVASEELSQPDDDSWVAFLREGTTPNRGGSGLDSLGAADDVYANWPTVDQGPQPAVPAAELVANSDDPNWLRDDSPLPAAALPAAEPPARQEAVALPERAHGAPVSLAVAMHRLRQRGVDTGALLKKAKPVADFLGNTAKSAGEKARKVEKKKLGKAALGVGKASFYVAQALPIIAPFALSYRLAKLGLRGSMGIREAGKTRQTREEYLKKKATTKGAIDLVTMDTRDAFEYYGGKIKGLTGKAKEFLAFFREANRELVWEEKAAYPVIIVAMVVLSEGATHIGSRLLGPSASRRLGTLFISKSVPYLLVHASNYLFIQRRVSEQSESKQAAAARIETVMQLAATITSAFMVYQMIAGFASGAGHHAVQPDHSDATPTHAPTHEPTVAATPPPAGGPTHTPEMPTATPTPLPATPTPEFTPTPEATATPGMTYVGKVDFNGDGASEYYVYDTNGDGSPDIAENILGFKYKAIDLDGDGKVDLIGLSEDHLREANLPKFAPHLVGKEIFLKVEDAGASRPFFVLSDGDVVGRDMDGDGVWDKGDLVAIGEDGAGNPIFQKLAQAEFHRHAGLAETLPQGTGPTEGFDSDGVVTYRDWDGDGKWDEIRVDDKWFVDLNADGRVDSAVDGEVIRRDAGGSGRPIEIRMADGKSYEWRSSYWQMRAAEPAPEEPKEFKMPDHFGKTTVLGPAGGIHGMVAHDLATVGFDPDSANADGLVYNIAGGVNHEFFLKAQEVFKVTGKWPDWWDQAHGRLAVIFPGDTFESLADKYGVDHARIDQIFEKYATKEAVL